MSIVDGKLNQTILYRQFLGTDGYGKPQYAKERPMPCRLEGDRRLVRDSTGKEVVSESRVFTAEHVGVQDAFCINGVTVPIIRVSEHPALDGSFSYCEVRL